MIPNRARISGFSLLELIIVLVIIGVILAAITISLTDRRLDNLKVEAQRIHALIQLAADQAVVGNQDLGFLFKDDRYFFVQLDDDDNWQPMSAGNSRRFDNRKLPEEVYSRVEISGLYNEEPEENRLLGDQDESDTTSGSEQKLLPQILLLSSAEVTPFVIRIGWDFDEPTFMQIYTQKDGSIRLIGPIYQPLDSSWDPELEEL